MIFSAAVWDIVNRRLVAKSIQELSYEQVLAVQEAGNGFYQVTLPGEVLYRFQGWRGVWGDFKVQPQSLQRREKGEPTPVRAGVFFRDTQAQTGMDDIILGNFLEEMHNTLYADMGLWQKQESHPVEELSCWDGLRLQNILSGHPKLLLNKGRFTWGASDQEAFAPENEKPFQLVWLALKKDLAVASLAEDLSWEHIQKQSLSESEKEKLGKILEEKKISLESFLLIPVHPWQWNRFLQTQFAGELAEGVLHFLGAFGDFYQPQISLRTLSNVSRRGNLDIKLPLTLLNTSSIRGIPERYIAPGPALSQALSEICRKDAFLAEKNVQILEEKAGLSYVQADFKKIPEAPYRYHEFLGVIWREAAESKIQNQEKAILAGSLSYRHNGKSLLGAYAKQAGVSLPIWLRDYFQHVVLPLYHLQLAHGIGLVSHGQNITVKLREGRPCGLLLKDFQGDLRLSESSPWKDLPAFSGLTKLPPAYLIHDLYTGHFVTVLRYVSETLQECDGFSESDFYAILAECIGDYLSTRSSQKNIHDEVNLLAQKMPRVVVNRVRFKIGYADAAARPLPLLGDDLKNPLYRGEK